MGELKFNEELHEYRVDGLVIPSVTQVLEAAGLSDMKGIPLYQLKRAANFGRAVHKAIELKCKGTLDLVSLAEPQTQELIPYLQAWDNFVEDFGYQCEKYEVRGYQPFHRYGFTADQQGIITKGDARILGPCIVDIKSGIPQASHKYQIAGYKIGLGKNHRTFLLYLNPDFLPRGYKIVFATDNRREQSIFLAALTLYHVRKEEGLL